MSADGGQPPGAEAPDLTSLLGSRICHDLISPLGAISNGVELLAMSGISAAPELALISESIENANARIRFFRVAFGQSGVGQEVPVGEIREILADMSRGGRLSYTWEPDTDLQRMRVKLAFLLLQCIESALPYGGDVQVLAQDDRWNITAHAERMQVVPELWSMLADDAPQAELTPTNIHFALVTGAARRAGAPLETRLEANRIEILF